MRNTRIELRHFYLLLNVFMMIPHKNYYPFLTKMFIFPVNVLLKIKILERIDTK